ncbi:MAG TPA: PQQ-binding-like beta-propeller repeat protein, partial [Magnetococcales bacterium]|nr:PQQ-binding-like beta-propeller repeat protein [Magnetococcales bacterium]
MGNRNNLSRWIAIFFLAFLFGCSSPGSWLQGDDKENKSEAIRTSLVAQPGQETGLRRYWKRSVAGSPDDHFLHPGRFVVTDTDIFVATFQGAVARLERKDGSIHWSKGVSESIRGGVAVDDKRVFVGTEDGELVALSRENGDELWRQRVSTSVASAPTVAEGMVIFTTLDNRLYALNAETGDTLWVNNNAPEILVIMGAAPPTVDHDRLFVGYSSGNVHAISLTNGKLLWSDDLTVVGGRTELDLLQDVVAAIVTDDRSTTPMANRMIFAV